MEDHIKRKQLDDWVLIVFHNDGHQKFLFKFIIITDIIFF